MVCLLQFVSQEVLSRPSETFFPFPLICPPPLPRYKPTPNPLRWHGTVCSNQRSQAFELSLTTERLQVDRGYRVLIKKLFKLNN